MAHFRMKDKINQTLLFDGVVMTGDITHVHKVSNRPMVGRFKGSKVVHVGSRIWTRQGEEHKLLMEG